MNTNYIGKQNKTICLDVDVIEHLSKEKNASGLINSLLADYYNTGKKEKAELLIALEEKRELRDKLNVELGAIETKLREIETKKEQVKEIFKNIPDEILQDFKDFENMDENILKNRYLDIYKVKYKFTWEELIKAFKEWKSN